MSGNETQTGAKTPARRWLRSGNRRQAQERLDVSPVVFATQNGIFAFNRTGDYHRRPMLTVSLVEDDDTDRELWCRHIRSSCGLRLLSAYATAEEAVRRFPHEKPDVALMDIKLPGMDGIECIRRLRQIVPPLSTHFIILTEHEDSHLIFEAFRAGARGYLLKAKMCQKSLLASVKEVATGGSPMTPSVARRLINHFEGPPNPTTHLTDKELAVLQDLTRGLSYKEIAGKHSISLDAVRKRIVAIYGKLRVHSRKDAVQFVQHKQPPSADRARL